MKHADILIWCARKELSVQVKHADILIRYARKEDITRNIEESQQKCSFGTVNKRFLCGIFFLRNTDVKCQVAAANVDVNK